MGPGLRPLVFFGPLVIAVLVTVLALSRAGARFFADLDGLKLGVMAALGPAFAAVGLFAILVCLWVFFAPLGSRRVGGDAAEPVLNAWEWFAVSLCTTIALGFLYWSIAEPVEHFRSPPAGLGITPGTEAAARFAMGVAFLHWGVAPYAIFCVIALAFAHAYSSLRHPFSLGSILAGAIGVKRERAGQALDVLALAGFSLALASAFGGAVSAVAEGLGMLLGVRGPALVTGVALALILAFLASAASGLLRGIVALSRINAMLFFILALILLLIGPTGAMIRFGLFGALDMLRDFLERIFYFGYAAGDPWPRRWTTLYWANWMAVAPITGVFLARISYGYTLREMVITLFFFPMGFVLFWLAVFGGAALQTDAQSGGSIYSLIHSASVSQAVYSVLSHAPLSIVMIFGFLVIVAISIVTVADSSTDAIGHLCAHGDPLENSKLDQTRTATKFTWGIIVALIAWFAAARGLTGALQTVASFFGLVGLVITFAAGWALLRWSFSR